MAYVPDPTNVNQPIDSVFAETASAEFRALKAYIQGLAFGSAPIGSSGLKNRLVGGDFSSNPWQRTTIGDGTAFRFIPDRWNSVRSTFAAGMTVQQAPSAEAGNQFAMRVQRDLANASTATLQVANSMETKDSLPLAGKMVTLAVRGVKGPALSGTGTLSLVVGTGTDQNVLNGFTGGVSIGAIDIANGFNSSTPTTLIMSALIPATTTQIAVNYSHIPSAVAAGATDYVDFEIVQLEDSPVFTGFERRKADLELLLCQRYYSKCYDITAVPGTVGNATGLLRAISTGANVSVFNVQFPNRMRVSPTCNTYSYVTGAAGQMRNESTGADIAAGIVPSGQTNLIITGTTAAPAQQTAVLWTASAEL
jgi:hypothetical protein